MDQKYQEILDFNENWVLQGFLSYFLFKNNNSRNNKKLLRNLLLNATVMWLSRR